MPASVPSSAARGVNLRIVGPTNAPMRTITPMMNAHARPACHAAIGSFVARKIGSITTNDDEHVRHARPEGERGHVAAALLAGQSRAR